MIVAMFLTKDLLIHWQWSAGTGTNAAPYFRIFNPVSQGEKFDAQGELDSGVERFPR